MTASHLVPINQLFDVEDGVPILAFIERFGDDAFDFTNDRQGRVFFNHRWVEEPIRLDGKKTSL